MKKLFPLILLALAGCGPTISYEQVAAVTEACHKAGMEFQVRGSQIICRTVSK